MPPEDAWGRATKYTSCDVAGDNLHLSQTVPLNFFSPFLYCVPAGVLWPSRLSFHQEPWSTQFWCSHCCPFGEHSLSISNAYPGLFLTLGLLMFVHIAVGSISCLASVSSKFSEDISGRMYRDSHHLFIWWFSRGQSITITQRWHLCWIFSVKLSNTHIQKPDHVFVNLTWKIIYRYL